MAVQFADLHDTPGRMAAVGVIRRAVPWAEARSFFYWRLRRRLAEFHLRKEVSDLLVREGRGLSYLMCVLWLGWWCGRGCSTGRVSSTSARRCDEA